MRSFFLEKWFKNITIAKKLYFTIGIMAFLIIMELVTLGFAIRTLSAVRSFVAGEGLWSKAQKDAVSHLRIYAYSHNEQDYQQFKQFLKVPLGDGKARMALEKKEPDLAMARQGFLEARNHPDDIDGMIILMLRFNQIGYISRTIFYWKQAEAALMELIPVSEQLHERILSGKISPADTKQVLDYIDKINAQLTPLEDGFSYTLGEGSRWFEKLILRILIGLALTVEVTGILIAISISRGIQKGLNEIIQGAEKVSKELFSTRVKVYSNDEIGVLAIAFNQMTDKLEQTIVELKESEVRTKKQKERAEESEKIKQLFIANMSHEIRTPMNAILGFSHLLRGSELSAEQEEYINAITKSGEFLQILLNNILDLSKIEAGKVMLERKAININELVQTALSMAKTEAAKKSLVVNFSIDEKISEVVFGDEMRLGQILINLITNAIKYTFIGSVFVEASFIKETDEFTWVEFSVQDTGIGIPVEKQDKIFESFEQVGRGKPFSGIGLGLSISRQLAELQGGSIFIKSSSPKGSDFAFILPFYKCEKINNKVNKMLVADNPGIVIKKEVNGRVLIADDNELNQLLISRILLKHGLYVDIAFNGRMVLDKLRANNYDLILMDLDMPEMDGYETTAAIRNWKNAKHNIPIIAVTAHATTEERKKCFGQGMNEFVAKPFNVDELYQKILGFLN